MRPHIGLAEDVSKVTRKPGKHSHDHQIEKDLEVESIKLHLDLFHLEKPYTLNRRILGIKH